MNNGLARQLENPFNNDPAIRQYQDILNTIAHEHIYGSGVLDRFAVKRSINQANRIPRLQAIEEQQHALETLYCLLNGLAAHEEANKIFNTIWQKQLREQQKLPTSLTREDVAKILDSFEFKDMLIGTEDQAIKYYEKLLSLDSDFTLTIGRNRPINISSKELKTDIEVLLIDLLARKAERLEDEEARKKAYEGLTSRMENIIDSIPLLTGKKLELMEIYLIRRLIHDSGMGHLTSVNHGVMREDYNPNRKSVDLRITAAGEVLDLQLTANEKKIAEKRAKLEGTGTRTEILSADIIAEAYEKARRQKRSAVLSKADKYQALQAIIENEEQERQRTLLKVLGLTEKDLEDEKLMASQNQEERRLHEAEMARKRAEDIKQAQEAHAKIWGEIQAKRAAEEARVTAKEARQKVVADKQAAEAEARLAEARATAEVKAEERRQQVEKLKNDAEKAEAARRKAESDKAEAEAIAEKHQKNLASAAKGQETKKRNNALKWAKKFGDTINSKFVVSLFPDISIQEQLAIKTILLRLFGKKIKNQDLKASSEMNDLFYSMFPKQADFEEMSESNKHKLIDMIRQET